MSRLIDPNNRGPLADLIAALDELHLAQTGNMGYLANNSK